MEAVKCKLIRLWTVGQKHGKDVYTGTTIGEPTVGHRFWFAKNDGEFLNTSTVKAVDQDGETFTFTTRNSKYMLKVGV